MSESIWRTDVSLPNFPKWTGDAKTEVCIIGGGITGLLTAHFLHERGIPYVLLEKNRICSGTTGNTTAKITAQHGLIYHQLLKRYGTETARGYLEANRMAMAKYDALCQQIDCDYERRDSFVYSTNDRAKLEAEVRALERIGCGKEVYFCEQIPLPLPTVGAVCFSSQAQFHPLKFLSAISEKLHVYEHSFVRKVDHGKVITDHGTVTADKVVMTAHFPFINTHGMYFLKMYQHRSYVIALEHAADVGGMYVDESKTGLSFRNVGNRLLLGGGGHRTGKQGGAWRELQRFAAEHYPNATVAAQWAAQDCMSLDGMPYVGRYSPNTPNLYTASGFNKWGMTGAMLSAMLLCDMICEEKNPYADLFSPSRSMFHPQLFLNALETTKNMLIPTTRRCSHLGCALKWNPAEHTWDCACHGSRFSAAGEILDNPANKCKKKKSIGR